MAIDFGDLASRYASARWDQATQPFTDPEAYMNNRLQQNFGIDMNGNTTPVSTTIKYNTDTGAPETVTTKHEVGATPAPDYTSGANYNLAAPSTAGLGLQTPATAQPVGMQMPQAVAPTAMPVPNVENQAIEEQKRKQLEQLQLQAAQAQAAQAAAPAPTGPAVPTVEREMPQPAPTAPVTPQAVAQQAAPAPTIAPPPAIGTLPTPGPGVQVAAAPGAALPVTQPAVTVSSPDEQHQQAIIDAHNEPNTALRRQKFAQIAATSGVSEDNQRLAHKYMAEDYLSQKKSEDAVKKLDNATPLDIARYMKDKSADGSYIKAILFARLGLTDLARQEQERISPSLAMGSEIGADGQRYSVVRDREGFITKAFDTTGREATPDKVAELSAASMATKGNIGHAGATRVRDAAGVEWSVVPTTRGSQFYDNTGKPGVPAGKTVPITVGGDVGLQNELALNKTRIHLEGVKAEDRVRTLEDINKKRMAEGLQPLSTSEVGIDASGRFTLGGGVAPAAGQQNAVQLATSLGLPITSGVRDQAKQQAMWDESVRAGRTGFMANGNPIAKPGTSAHQNAMAVDGTNWTPEQKQLARTNGLVNPYPNDPNHWELRPQAGVIPSGVIPPAGQSVAEITRQREEAAKVAAKRGESFNKHVDETITPDAINGDSISSTRKQQFALFDRPGVDAGKIFGIANGAGAAPGDQRWTMFRDILLGKVSEPADKIRERAAALGLNREEQSAAAEYAIANADINSKTLKSTAGPGSVSEAEQKINQERNVDPTKVPMLGGYNAMAQSQFNGDLARYKGDWATNSTATNTAQLEKDWRKEKDKLVKIYTDVAQERIKYIADMGNTPAAIKEGYKRFPVPQYDPNANGGEGGWIKKKPLSSYER